MEKKANSEGCCPVVQAVRHVSHRAQGPRPASPAPSSSPPTPVKNIDTASKPGASKHHKSMEAAQIHSHNKQKNGEAAGVVPIIFEYSSQQLQPSEKTEPAASNGQVAHDAVQNSRQGKRDKSKYEAPPHVNTEEGKKFGVHIEDRFTDYINRAKIKLRTMSRSGDHEENASGIDQKKASGKDRKDNSPVKDKFAEYINRAKIKIRSTSGIGVGKNNSSK